MRKTSIKSLFKVSKHHCLKKHKILKIFLIDTEESKRNNNMFSHIKSGKGDTDELSLYSSKVQTGIVKSSVQGKADNSVTNGESSSKNNIDWITTGLYRAFKNQYQKVLGNHPYIENKELKVTTLDQGMSDLLFEKYYEEKILNRADRRKDILKDVHAEAGLKYIKRNLAFRYGERASQDQSDPCLDQSFQEFNKVVHNYYYLGLETLRYLMDMLNLSRNFNRIQNAYDKNTYQDVMKCLLRCMKIYDGIECLGSIFLYIK